jgi:hypothetical protein
MRKRKTGNWKENGHPPACPHCRTGGDGVLVGLFWDFNERCWRCVICGYRGFEGVVRSLKVF